VVSNDIRNQLILLAGSSKTRSSLVTRARPTGWGPPDTGEAFTPVGAWLFVIELLKAGTEVETMILDKPPGKTGYVMKCPGWAGEIIYIKLQLGSGLVYGRSFHVSRDK
jgi:hypothetical protein